MKIFLVLLMLLACQITFSQNKKKSVPPPPPKIKLLPPPPSKTVNKVLAIVNADSSPLSFKFEIIKDTVLMPNAQFAEIIELSGSSYPKDLELTLLSRTASDTLKIEKAAAKGGELIALSYFEKRMWCDASVDKELIIATDKDSKKKLHFKAVLDKAKKKILYLENTKTKRKYFPAPYEAPAPSIGF